MIVANLTSNPYSVLRTLQRLPPAGPDSVEPFSNFPLLSDPSHPFRPLLLVPNLPHYTNTLSFPIQLISPTTDTTVDISCSPKFDYLATGYPWILYQGSPGTLFLVVPYACRCNHHRHHSIICFCTDEPMNSTKHLPFTTQKVQTTTNSPSFSISLDALWETSAAIRPMFIQGSLIVPSPYLRIPSTADQTPWTVCLPCPILARLAMPSLSSFCFHDQPEVFMMLSKLPEESIVDQWQRNPHNCAMVIAGSSSSPFGLTSPVSHSMTPVLEPYRPPLRFARGHGPQPMHTPRVPVVWHPTPPPHPSYFPTNFLTLLNQQLATDRVSVPTAFKPHTVPVVAAQPRAASMMTATTYITASRATAGCGEREEKERDKKFTAVLTTTSLAHLPSTSNPLSLDLSHESYSYLLVGSSGNQRDWQRAQKAPSNGFMGPMSLAVGVDDVGPLAPSPTPRPPAAGPKSNKSRLPYCLSVASVLFVYLSASSRASPSAPRTSLDVCQLHWQPITTSCPDRSSFPFSTLASNLPRWRELNYRLRELASTSQLCKLRSSQQCAPWTAEPGLAWPGFPSGFSLASASLQRQVLFGLGAVLEASRECRGIPLWARNCDISALPASLRSHQPAQQLSAAALRRQPWLVFASNLMSLCLSTTRVFPVISALRRHLEPNPRLSDHAHATRASLLGSTWAMESVIAAAGDGERGGSQPLLAESKPALKAATDMQRRPSHGGWGWPCQALGLRPDKRSLDRSTTTGRTILLEPFPCLFPPLHFLPPSSWTKSKVTWMENVRSKILDKSQCSQKVWSTVVRVGSSSNMVKTTYLKSRKLSLDNTTKRYEIGRCTQGRVQPD
ncbi:uncharacterized protein CLUP02_12498 [Colletotrichum lupini]|uniref:Uncharacterized protein n=1 Tax=Colletotrichum lupini TaxID=145971 RepID=A0A9Q8T2G1_9PEZI|nr:uncharacterized protein CLUP02_12498 [Colletotrichum lupini]UQC86996.1 hypothetical protein CLUP02_12498 [Colletotrichum lupini]